MSTAHIQMLSDSESTCFILQSLIKLHRTDQGAMKSVCKHVTNSHQNNTSHRLKEQTDLGSQRIRHMASGGLVYHRGNHKHQPSLEESDSASAPLQQYRYCKVTATFPLSYWYTRNKLWNLSSCKCYYDDVTAKLGSLFSMINGRQSTTCILSV